VRIAVNAITLGRRRTGIGNFTYYVLKELLARDEGNDYLCFVPADAPSREEIGLERAEWLVAGHTLAGALRNAWWENVVLPAEVRRRRARVLFSPSYLVPLLSLDTPVVIAVHDLSFLIYPKSKSFLFGNYMRSLFPISLRRARVIVTGSRSTERQLLRMFPSRVEGKVVVCPYGVDRKVFRKRKDAREIVSRAFGLKGEFLLAVGTIEERKNISRLVRAFSIVRRAGFERLRLVVAGGRGWGYEEVFRTVEEQGLEREIVFPGHVREEELVSLYGACTAFVQPSFYEGFGLPILEAMACGAPVVLSDSSSHPEVAGEKALYFDPSSADDMAEALLRILRDPALREELGEAGPRRVELFPWSSCALKIGEQLKRFDG